MAHDRHRAPGEDDRLAFALRLTFRPVDAAGKADPTRTETVDLAGTVSYAAARRDAGHVRPRGLEARAGGRRTARGRDAQRRADERRAQAASQ